MVRVEGEIYQPAPQKKPNWYEYKVELYAKGQLVDRWDSGVETYTPGQKLTKKQAEEAIEEIKEDVEEKGKIEEWFSLDRTTGNMEDIFSKDYLSGL